MAVKPIPDGYHSVTPYLSIRGATQALEFYKKAFGAEELMRVGAPGGKIGHAEIQLGDSRTMLADEHPEMNFVGPQSRGGSTVVLVVYLPDVDSACKRAVDAGAKVLRPLADQFYGDRTVVLEDPFGHVWTLSTHKEDLTPEEIGRRAATAHK